MKKFLIVLISLMMVFGFVSCTAENIMDHGQVVRAMVNVDRSAGKTLTAVSNVEDAVYEVVYKMTAVPKWTANDKAIVGALTDEVVKVKDPVSAKYLVKNNGDELYFSQGQWDLTIDCYYKISGTEYLKYTGSRTVFFNNSNAAASIVLGALPEDEGTDTLSFSGDITVVNTNNTDTLIVSIDGAETAFAKTTTANIHTYTLADQTLAVGNHTVLVQVKQNGAVVGGREFSFTLGVNETVTISGSIDASKYINGKIDMGEDSAVETLKIELTAQADKSVAKNAGTTVSAGISSVTTGATVTYQWYLDGTVIAGATNATYSVPTTTEPGCYDFTCKITATKDGISITKSNNTRVTVNF